MAIGSQEAAAEAMKQEAEERGGCEARKWRMKGRKNEMEEEKG